MSIAKDRPLFDLLGGQSAIDAVVDDFYDRILSDFSLISLFDIDRDALRKKQKVFLAYVFGGPTEYDGKNMREAHKGLVENHGLNDQHFDAVCHHLQETLQDAGVESDLIQKVLAIAESTRDDVLGR